MIIVIEGCDGTGKSSLANLLNDKLGYRIIHGSSFEIAQKSPAELYDWFNALLEYDDIIIDRFIYSNLVYATLYPIGNSIITEEMRNRLEDKLSEKNGLVVYLFASKEKLIERLSKRGEDYIENDKIENILSLYESIMVDAQVDLLSIDTEHATNKDVLDIVSEVVDMII